MHTATSSFLYDCVDRTHPLPQKGVTVVANVAMPRDLYTNSYRTSDIAPFLPVPTFFIRKYGNRRLNNTPEHGIVNIVARTRTMLDAYIHNNGMNMVIPQVMEPAPPAHQQQSALLAHQEQHEQDRPEQPEDQFGHGGVA
ncbi:unnamed protein product [Bursaphelenchus okinawaensis]|uniref:Uncharacterized protein n=1 Tax=Bursaphelenchus okinawaensis TaxID=465554 RepID=A0A811KPJ0_9BILA|nr:unnamed protein product [Bursaphelenchus okinawaensis]CAG9107384.1 unnamed protein product [Bursaphelenchus okinawaensis]